MKPPAIAATCASVACALLAAPAPAEPPPVGPPPVERTTLAQGDVLVGLNAGVAFGMREDDRTVAPAPGTERPKPLLGLPIAYGITDRAQWVAPLVLAVRLGRAEQVEVVPWAGISGLAIGFSNTEGAIQGGHFGAGAGLRWWLGAFTSGNLVIGTRTLGLRSSRRLVRPDTLEASATLGVTHALGDRVVVSLGAGLDGYVTRAGSWEPHAPAVVLGSVQRLGGRDLPLVRVRVSDRISIEGHLQLMWELLERPHLGTSFRLGVTQVF